MVVVQLLVMAICEREGQGKTRQGGGTMKEDEGGRRGAEDE